MSEIKGTVNVEEVTEVVAEVKEDIEPVEVFVSNEVNEVNTEEKQDGRRKRGRRKSSGDKREKNEKAVNDLLKQLEKLNEKREGLVVKDQEIQEKIMETDAQIEQLKKEIRVAQLANTEEICSNAGLDLNDLTVMLEKIFSVPDMTAEKVIELVTK